MITRIFIGLKRRIWHLISRFIFAELGSKSFMEKSLSIQGSKNISIGSNVYVGYKAWLAAVPHTGAEKCELVIGNGSRIGNFNHIYATNSIVIEENVLTADKVYISDNLHSYEDVGVPILQQPIKQIKTVIIGEGSWLGENVCVIGARIGKHCVIGANSVVTKDVPNYSVVVGAPARIIKRYCFETKTWRKTDKKGNFVV